MLVRDAGKKTGGIMEIKPQNTCLLLSITVMDYR